MKSPEEIALALIEPVLAAPQKSRRKLVAVSGPPASGKSTLAEVLAAQLTEAGCTTSVVPMDGFHMDNRVLMKLGLLDRKGAPETFDVDGLTRLVKALPHLGRVFYPVFDRDEDLARAAAGMIDHDCDCVVIEGNYLLFDGPRWSDLPPYWDVSVRVDVPEDELQRRLVQRWLEFGLAPVEAEKRALGNDMVNARLIAKHALPASITV